LKLLLDTHAFIFLTSNPAALPSVARNAMEDPGNELFLSIASPWEMQIKSDLGKLHLHDSVLNLVEFEIDRGAIRLLPLELAHIDELSRLPPIHRDPFDRIIVAQTRCEGMQLISGDGRIRQYGVDVTWD
jgi:PIN domain nuclease of toxin-antitoxin system